MKKLFIAVLSMATLASCFQSELALDQAIDFNTYVGSTTKAIDPSINNDNITDHSFYVWGTTQENITGAPIVPIFKNVEVDYVGGVWKYDPQYTQYWFSGNKYNFAAVVNGVVADATLVEGLPKTISYTAGTDLDLLYARTAQDITRDSNGAATVAFTFEHLLSKAVFTFTNTTPANTNGAPANIYKVTNIEISGLDAAAVYDVESGWTNNENADLDVEFGNIVASNESDKNNTAAIEVKEQESGKSLYEHLLIPGTHNVTISCNIVLYNGVADADHIVKTIPYSETHTITLGKGKAYNFALSAGLEEIIDFKVNTVNEWENGNTADGDSDGVNDHYPIL